MAFQKLDLSNRKRSGGRNVVFLYGYDRQMEQQLNEVTKSSGIDSWILIDEQRKMQVVKELIDTALNNDDVQYEEQTEKVILFHGTSQYELQKFITQIKAVVEGKPYIAMVTPTSKKWVFMDLIEELKKERNSLNQ